MINMIISKFLDPNYAIVKRYDATEIEIQYEISSFSMGHDGCLIHGSFLMCCNGTTAASFVALKEAT